MSKSTNSIVIEISELVRSKGNNEAITFKWADFYKVCKRERLYDTIMEDIEKKLKEKDLHIVFGNNAVIVVKDYNWNSAL